VRQATEEVAGVVAVAIGGADARSISPEKDVVQEAVPEPKGYAIP